MFIARDLNGALFLYGEEPVRKSDRFIKQPSDDFNPLPLPPLSNPEVTWLSSPCKLKVIWNYNSEEE